jgi:tRNA (guanine-N7-)-methyltransferase
LTAVSARTIPAMVSTGMKRYRVRSEAQAALVGPPGEGVIDLTSLFSAERAGWPLRVDIGFGHGEFISALAAAHPSELFVGVELDPLRVTKTAHKCLKLGLTNVRLFNGEAHAFVRFRLPPGRVQRAYVLFPDPWPKAAHRRRRLLNRSFLLDLSHAIAPGGRLVIASDTHDYAFQALSNFTTIPNLWRSLYPNGYRFDIPTRFPTVFERHKKEEGCSICYLHLERTVVGAVERASWYEERSG